MQNQPAAVRIGAAIVISALTVLGITGCSSQATSTTASLPVTTTAMSVSQLMATATTNASSMPKIGITTSTVVNSLKTSMATVTITGYISTEDDFAMKLGADTAGMINMKMMAMSGLGITRKMDDGTWEFYFFNGGISSGDSVNGKWAFTGTGPQMDAWNIVLGIAAKTPNAPVPVTVTGVLKGDTMTNPGMDADGLYFPVITVASIDLK